MSRRITIIQGHPDTGAPHFCHALGEAYASGAEASGHEIRTIDVAALPFPLLRSPASYDADTATLETLKLGMDAIQWAEHLVIIYPLWLGTMPALLKGYFEQVLRPGFAFSAGGPDSYPRGALGGRSARIIVTMGMPGWVYRWVFGAHSLKSLERNILKFVGIKPIRETIFGGLGQASTDRQKLETYVDRVRKLGASGS